MELSVDRLDVKQGDKVLLFLHFEESSGTLRDSYAQGIFRRNSFSLLENAGSYLGYGLTDDALLAQANRGFTIPNDDHSTCMEPFVQSVGGGSAPLLTSGGPAAGGGP